MTTTTTVRSIPKLKVGDVFKITNTIAYGTKETFTYVHTDEDGTVVTTNRYGDKHIFLRGFSEHYNVEIV